MKVLVACEYSGIVREAFAARGHDAWSCDLLPTEIPGNHIHGDVISVLKNDWHMMIGFPPCIFISFAATKYWNQPGRAAKRLKALEFFNELIEAPIERICIENPLGCADSVIRKHDQIINPYYFGDPHLKRSCLWLKNLPKLTYTLEANLFEQASACDRPEPIYIGKKGRKRYFTDATGGYHGEGNSFKKRSKTFQGIADAMAEQWG